MRWRATRAVGKGASPSLPMQPLHASRRRCSRPRWALSRRRIDVAYRGALPPSPPVERGARPYMARRPCYPRAVPTQQRLPMQRDRSAGGASTLEGTLERVAFINEENAWSVVKIAVEGRREPVTAVGNLLGVKPGESLYLSGKWINDKRFGEQFQVESFQTVVPATLAGIERYLGSGLVHGIGKVMAERLVARFGLKTLEIIDEHPERLTEVEGIGRVRSDQIKRAWVEQRAIKDVMVFLHSHGVAMSHATKIYKRYGDK